MMTKVELVRTILAKQNDRDMVRRFRQLNPDWFPLHESYLLKLSYGILLKVLERMEKVKLLSMRRYGR